MDASAIVVVAAILGAIVFLVTYFGHEARIRRALRKAPRVHIAEVNERQAVKIEGQLAYAKTPLRAPLTGRACALFEVIVEEMRHTGKRARWVAVIRERESQDFFVDDGTGRALVRMPTPQIAVVKDAHFRSGTFNDPSPELEGYLDRHGRTSRGWLFNKKIRYREGVLEAGETVAVCGWANREIDPTPRPSGYREMPTRLVLAANGPTPLIVSDDPRALERR